MRTLKTISVILADDQAEVRIALRRYLDRDGRFLILAEANDGIQAIKRVEMFRPDALILDLAMPNLDGLQALPQILEASPKTKVIVLSSMVPFGGIGEQALAMGATAAFDKYVPPEKIIAELIASTRDQDPSGAVAH